MKDGQEEKKEKKEETAVQIVNVCMDKIVKPAVNAQEALDAWDAYEDLKKKIVKDSDVQDISGKKFLKKSYWRKIKTFFNLSVSVVSENYVNLPNGDFAFNFVMRASAPNGAFADAAGSCTAYDKAKWDAQTGKFLKKGYKGAWEVAVPNSYHNVRATAETRAFNRCVSNLVGGGEVSAEEVEDIHEAEVIKAENVPPANNVTPNNPPVETSVESAESKATVEKAKETFGATSSKDKASEFVALTPLRDADGKYLMACCKCKAEVEVAVRNYSLKQWGKVLCRDHQNYFKDFRQAPKTA